MTGFNFFLFQSSENGTKVKLTALASLWIFIVFFSVLLNVNSLVLTPLKNFLSSYEIEPSDSHPMSKDRSLSERNPVELRTLPSLASLGGGTEFDNELNNLQGEVEQQHITIAGLSDVLLITSLVSEAHKTNFRHIWKKVEFLWQDYADHAFANFEGCTGPVNLQGKLVNNTHALNKRNKNLYTSGISAGGFNYHQDLAKELAESGIDIMTTANNHAFDRGFEGIASTIRILKEHGIVPVGTLDHPSNPTVTKEWFQVTEEKGWRIAWLGCTTILCASCRRSLRAPEEQAQRQVLFCHHVPNMVSELSARSDIDAVIVGAHWGAQFKDEPRETVVKLAKDILDAGAVAIIGNHPHVMQPAMHYQTKDGRNTYVTFSLGSLTSGLGSWGKNYKLRTSAVDLVQLTRKSRIEQNGNKKTWAEVAKVEYVPICEIWVNKNGTKLREMTPTEHVLNDECKREEQWAIKLLGEKDFRKIDELKPVEIN